MIEDLELKEKESFSPQKPIAEFGKKERILLITTFVSLGTASLLIWNCLLNILPSLRDVLFPSLGSFTDTVTATYGSALCVFSLFLIFYPITKTVYVEISLGFLLTLVISFILVCYYSPESYVSALIHGYAGLAGFFVTIVMSGTFSIGAVIEKTCLSSASIGMGVSGLMTAVIWTIFVYGIFNNTASQIQIAVAIFMVLGGLFITATLILVVFFNNSSSVLKLLNIEKKNKIYFNHDLKFLRLTTIPDKITWATHKYVVRKAYRSILSRGLVFFETCLIFPTIGPMAWGKSTTLSNIYIILFQFFDFGGRFSTELFPKINLSETHLVYALIARIILLVPGVMMMTYSTNAFFGNIIVHIIFIIVLAFTNGWLGTTAAMYLPKNLETTGQKSLGGAWGLASTFWGVVAGQWSSKLLKDILIPMT